MCGYNVSFVGAGRVASVLCKELYESGNKIINIVSRHEFPGVELAKLVNASWSDKPVFDENTDIIIVAVTDSALPHVLAEIQCNNNTIVVHTAGSYGLDIFPDDLENIGVLYPVQTFSKGRQLNLNGLPFLLETSNEHVFNALKKLVDNLGSVAYKSDLDHRKFLHVAAVFSCNFVNHMLVLGKKIVAKSDLPFEILKPLVQETIQKAFENGPENSQTGPAIRNDANTLKMHEELLSFDPKLRDLYDDITNSISETCK